jgi:hypothetical protein
LHIDLAARAESRALAGGLVLGATVGVLLGGAYWAGAQLRGAPAGGATVALRGEAGFSAADTVRFPIEGANGRLPALRGPLAPAPAADATDQKRSLTCLSEAVYYEARGETPAGQAAVAQVVLNRMRNPAFPKTVCGVVFQGVHTSAGCQFSFACDGAMNGPREPAAWRRAQQVASRALEGFRAPGVGSATHFHVVGDDPGWGPRLLRVAQIGLHVFYRMGRPEAAAPAPKPAETAAPATPHMVFASMTLGVTPAAAPLPAAPAAPAPPKPADPAPVAAPAPPAAVAAPKPVASAKPDAASVKPGDGAAAS